MMLRRHRGALASIPLLPLLARGAFVTFDNCLPDSVQTQTPLQLQFTPYFVDASYNNTLSLTIYGNVSGQQYRGAYPAWNSSHWQDNSSTPDADQGKITNTGGEDNDKYTTLTALYEVVTYTAYDFKGEPFCQALENGSTCPLGPAFYANGSVPYDLPSFSLSHDFGSSYSFSTISTTVKILSGFSNASDIGCISVQVTPDLGTSVAGMLTWLPAAVLVLKGIATLLAAIYSPWGSSDIFRWSSNYGRDEDLLRLVTPGFGDCLQYIQFIALTGSLTLQYPGFFQPAVSQSTWSCLLFNESFVSNGPSTSSLIDGVYTANATYGLTQMSQLIGMANGQDIWACMAIWLLVISGIVVLACQLGFFSRWVYRKVTNTTEEDLRRKNLPFTVGNLIRLLLNFFILPIVSLSLFQLVISARSPISVVVCATLLLVIMIIAAGWILRVIFATRPRTLLFDDMPTVLLYGPLYNTYSDTAAPFALIPTGLTFMRGVAIGAVQPSGIAQIIILAICEVVLLLTLNGFRPFQGQTSMNIYHTLFSSARVITILLMIAFVPSLGVTEGPKGWIGYAILILHGFVLLLGFFLNAAQTIIEVIARSLGAGGDAQSGAVRGSILTARMLKRRRNRTAGSRGSMTSDAAILRTDEDGMTNYGGRSRSLSASSHQLLNRHSGFDFTGADPNVTPDDADVVNGTKKADDYYRPPRPRKATLDALSSPGTRTRQGSNDFPYRDAPPAAATHARESSYDSHHAHDSPAPAYFRDRLESADHTSPRTDYAVREVDQYYRGPALNDQPTRKLKTGPADPEGPASTAQSWFQRNILGAMGGKKRESGKGFEVVRSARAPPGMPQETGDGVELQTSPAMRQGAFKDSPPTPQGEIQASSGTVKWPAVKKDFPGSPQDEMQAASGADRATPNIEDAEDPWESRPKPFNFGFDRNSYDYSTGRNRPESDTVPPHTAGIGIARSVSPISEHRHSADSASDYDRASSRGDSLHPAHASDAPTLAPIDVGGDGLNVPSRFPSTATSQVKSPSRQPSVRSMQVGSDWLRAVDALGWDHNRQSDASMQPAFRVPPPSVPRRNSQRKSQNYGTTSQAPVDIFGRNPELVSPLPPHAVEPGKDVDHRVGITTDEDIVRKRTNASHHRAGDSISRNSIGANAATKASRVEFFDGNLPDGKEGGFI